MSSHKTGTRKKILRLILGDQLNHYHPWYSDSEDAEYVMMEIRQETDYVTHHVQKVVGIFLAMEAFADDLRKIGKTVHYIFIDDSSNKQNISENILDVLQRGNYSAFEYQLPDEYRLDEYLKSFCKNINIPSRAVDTFHFLTERSELAQFFAGKKQLVMENFYRYMRKKHRVLMNGDEPEGGKWNYDHDNRQSILKGTLIPPTALFPKNVKRVLSRIKNSGAQTMGNIEESSFIWPVTRQENLQLLEWFCDFALPVFGRFQDAMQRDQWSLFHSRLSFGMNSKLISPKEVMDSVLSAWKKNPKEISLQQVEGFVRQILGWREYMRGIYWKEMPGFARLNFFNHEHPLPHWYWTGETKMECLKQSINQSLNYAYAHHIQRLMVTGNFALLAGIHPDEVDQWYLGIYIDAFEWVEITNTRGMSQYADGGIIGSKPYVSSANYIDKMSNYCSSCHYNKKEKLGEKACPFNALYWHFYARNRQLLEKNPRIGMMYRVWDKMKKEERTSIIEKGDALIGNLNGL